MHPHPSDLETESDLLPDPDADLAGADVDDWFRTLRPVGPLQEWFARRIILASVRLRRYSAQENALWVDEAARARLTWDEDRRLAAAVLGAKLARDPARHALRLEIDRHGAEWLASRWLALADIASAGHPWTDAQRSLALDLLGRPRDLRHDASVPPDPPAQAALARAQLARLESRLESRLIARDEHERSLAASGLNMPLGPAMTRIQRLESQWRHEFHASLRALRALQQRDDPPAPPTPPRTPAPLPMPDPGPDAGAAAVAFRVAAARLAAKAQPAAAPPPPAPARPPADAPAPANRKARRAQARRDRSAR